MIRYLADTNILGCFVRRTHPTLQRRMRLALEREEIALSAITHAEGLKLEDWTLERKAVP